MAVKKAAGESIVPVQFNISVSKLDTLIVVIPEASLPLGEGTGRAAALFTRVRERGTSVGVTLRFRSASNAAMSWGREARV